ncbi:non-ribosomal peptide synthetase [Actinoplanes sp. TFC3]|uniref:non-ribosomal peptide synthetase n=1 Tax=Actinoplanes sp. TFC3 TaxID=1710355 RepID=UPI000B318EAA|nr:non-ribosomal peptide synthetase [Actinoplanes sp. TFC3]
MGTDITPLVEIMSAVLSRPVEDVVRRAQTASFTELGGSSLDAMKAAVRCESELGRAVDVLGLLGFTPLAETLAAVSEATARPAAPALDPDPRWKLEPVPEQQGFLHSEALMGDGSQNQVFGLELTGPLHVPTLTEAVHRLIARHESLRTAFRQEGDGWSRRVLPEWLPGVIRQHAPTPATSSPVEMVNSALDRGSRHFTAALGRPPMMFLLTRFAPQHHLLTFVFHHALADGWSIGLLTRELLDVYGELAGGPPVPLSEPSTPELLAVRRAEGLASGRLAGLAARRVEQLRDYPTVVELPTDAVRPDQFDFRGDRLRFGLGAAAREGAEMLAKVAGVSRTAVLLAAWQLVIARRTGQSRFLIGTATSRRTDPRLIDLIAPCAALVPIRCDVRDDRPVREYLQSTAQSLVESVEFADVPIGELARSLQAVVDGRRMPLAQIGFSAHDQILPADITAGELTATVHESYAGWAASDASLFVQHWDKVPKLVLEYATSALTTQDALGLATAYEATLADLSADPEAALGTVRGMSREQRAILDAVRNGPDVERPDDLWQLISRAAGRHPDNVAVREADGRSITYRDLMTAAAHQSVALAAQGVGEGDVVAIAVPRSIAETVAILGTLRLGAAYVGLDVANPPARLAHMLALSRPAVVLATADRRERLAALTLTCPVLEPVDGPAVAATLPAQAPAPVGNDPGRVAYLVFTSGSTGLPKAVRIAHRGVTRLADRSVHLPIRPDDRMLRVAPLSFDASVLEIFPALANGASIEAFPDALPEPGLLADFLQEHAITTSLLITALFRAVAGYRPEAFATMRILLVGGDVVPVEPVRDILTRFPGLVLSNAYGPTEGTVIATQYPMTDPAEVEEQLPIGGPIDGTGIVLLDQAGGLVPPGGVGEICCLGPGVAIDYLDDPVRTKAAFGRLDIDGGEPGTGPRLYRSGDLARWDTHGRLRFLGRRDGQVKVRGFRIELGEIRERIAAHPAIADVVVGTTDGDDATRRVLAGVVLAEPLDDAVAEFKRFCAETLAPYAVPARWALVAAFPLTPNSKVDMGELQRIAQVQQ